MPEKEPWRETQTHEPTLRLNRRRWDGLIGCRPLVTGFYWSLIPVNATTESWNEICPNNKKRGLCGETQTWELACWLNPINPESDQRLASGCKGLTDGGKWFLGGGRPPVITGFYRNPRYLCTLQNNWKLKRVTSQSLKNQEHLMIFCSMYGTYEILFVILPFLNYNIQCI